MHKLNSKFDEFDKLNSKFDELDKLHVELDVTCYLQPWKTDSFNSWPFATD